MNFKLREMTEADLIVALQWRNDPKVLKTAMTPNPISYKEYEAMLLYNNAIKLIFEVDGIPAGNIQISRDPDKPTGEWSFHLSKDYRGKGLSMIMLSAALYYLASKEGYEEVTAKVKFDNEISKEIHNKLGFEFLGYDKDNNLDFKKKLCTN